MSDTRTATIEIQNTAPERFILNVKLTFDNSSPETLRSVIAAALGYGKLKPDVAFRQYTNCRAEFDVSGQFKLELLGGMLWELNALGFETTIKTVSHFHICPACKLITTHDGPMNYLEEPEEIECDDLLDLHGIHMPDSFELCPSRKAVPVR